LIDLAEHQGDSYIPMKDVASRQGLSLKYLERIVPVLTKNHYITGVHGKGGGYKLTRPPEDCRVGDIFRLTERDLAPVACLERGAEPCKEMGQCRTIAMWNKLNHMINEFFDGVTIADLMVEE
jgi:Rrf2 family protein